MKIIHDIQKNIGKCRNDKKKKKKKKKNKLQPKALISTSEIDVNIIQRRTP